MSAADVTDGNSGEVAHGGSEEEAAWLDLIGRFDAPAYPDDAPPPWPESENLPSPADGAGGIRGGSAPAGDGGVMPAADGGTAPAPAADDEITPAVAADGGTAAAPGWNDEAGPAPAGNDEVTPGPAADGGITPAPAGNDAARPTHARNDGVIRPAAGNGAAAPPAFDPLAEEHFVPEPPPPLPRLSPVQKGAWVALFGGPGYLLTATLAGWSVPGLLAIAAIAAFVGGFVTLVLHLGDGRGRDSGPDDGAVV